MVYGSNDYEVDYSYMPRQQKTNNVTTTIGTTTFVDKVSTYKLSGDARILDNEDVVEYDSLGNITKYGYVTYVYDGLGRLVRENNPSIDRIIVWEYNTGNNPTKRTEYIYTTGSLGNALKTSVLAYNSNWKDQVTSIDGQSVTYDKAGNPNKYHAMTMSWTRGRLLSTCSLNGKNVEFIYDGDGRRVKKLCTSGDDITEHNYTYDGSRIVADDSFSFVNYNQVLYKLQYFYNQQGVVGFRLNNDYYFFRKNLFGDIIAIYNSYGARVARYAYDAYGVCKVMSSGGAVNTDKDFVGNINPFRYRGYYYDVETGFYYCGSRYFVPQLGMWLNHEDMLDKQDAIHTTSSVPTVKAMAVVATATKNEEKPADSPFKGWVYKTTDTSIFAGFDSDESANPISWLQYKMFYVDAGILRGSLFDVKVAVMSLTFRTPDAFGDGFKNSSYDSHAYLNIDVLAAEGSLSQVGASGKLKLISAEVGLQIEGFSSIGAEAYVGYGKTVKYSNGEFRFGVGNGIGFEISIKVDIAKLINMISEWFR